MFCLRSQIHSIYEGDSPNQRFNPARPGISVVLFQHAIVSKLDLAANTNNWAYNDLIHWERETADHWLLILINLGEVLIIRTCL